MAMNILGVLFMLPLRVLACSYSEAPITQIRSGDYAFFGLAEAVIGPIPTNSDPSFGGPTEIFGLRVKVISPIIPNVVENERKEVYAWGPCGSATPRAELLSLLSKRIRVIAREYPDRGIVISGGFSPMELDEPQLIVEDRFDYALPKKTEDSNIRRFHYWIDLQRLKTAKTVGERSEIVERLLKDDLYGGDLGRSGKLKGFVETSVQDAKASAAILEVAQVSVIQKALSEILQSKSEPGGHNYIFQVQRISHLLRNTPDVKSQLRAVSENDKDFARRRLAGELLMKFSVEDPKSVKSLEHQGLARISWQAEGRLLMNVSWFWRQELAIDNPARNKFLNYFGEEYAERPDIHEDLDNVSIAVTDEMERAGIAALEKKNARWAIAALLLHEDRFLKDRATALLREWNDQRINSTMEGLASQAESHAKGRPEVVELRGRLPKP